MIKRTPLDAAFSDAVRWSYDWQCQFTWWNEQQGIWERCGMNWPECKGADAHNSHFIGRSNLSTRWHPDNCVLICAAHHKLVGNDPALHTSFFRRQLGDARYEMLRIRKEQIVRYRPKDRIEIKQHYRDEVRRIEQMRKDGVIGPVPLTSYD